MWIENRIEELRLVDYTARLFRKGKAAISSRLAGIFEQIGSTTDGFELTMVRSRGCCACPFSPRRLRPAAMPATRRFRSDRARRAFRRPGDRTSNFF